MMEQLKKVVEDSKMFDWVVKVVLGENNDPYSLQQSIAQYIGKNLTETTKDARADRLHKVFEARLQKDSKKMLVIMDDLWKEFELKDVGLWPLPSGVKLLFTSRFESVCSDMGVKIDSIFKVGVLNDSEAQTLFFRTAGESPSDGDETDVQRIGEAIVKKCGGLPIAIVTIAKNLRGNIKQAWKEALSNLQHDNLQDLDGILNKIFEMSYNNLKKEDDKSIFLLAGLFPNDFNIPIEDLMMNGWELKLFAKVHTLIQARVRANICVNNLIRANLLTKSDSEGCVKMHDLMRAFVLSNFSKVKQASTVNHNYASWAHLTKDSYDRVLLKCTSMSEFPANFNCRNLSLLVLMDGYELLKFPEDMFKQMKKLEVVSYENMAIPKLPITFKHSCTLRTLCLRSCSLTDDISFLGSLCNLETLNLANCNIRRLPATIGKLKKQFTHASCDELEKLTQVLSALELEFFDNKLQPRNASFKILERFRISIGCELKNYEKYSFINTLNLAVECNELSEYNIRDLFGKTEELRLQVKYMIRLEDVSLNHAFSELRFLHISKCAELRYLFTVDVANGLKRLEHLIVSECLVLKTLIDENSGVGVVKLKKLNVMSLNGLPEMVSLWDNVIELPEMVELRLDGLPKFTSIYPDIDSNSTSEVVPLFNRKDVTPKLEKLDISMMKNLKQIWPSTSEKYGVSTLRDIRVRECDSLINLFPSNPLLFLNHLEVVVIETCGSIEVLFNIDFESDCLKGRHGTRLRRIKVDNLTELWRMRGINNSDVHVNSFKDVEKIQIRDCKRFANIFTRTTTNFDLGGLRYYLSWNNGGDLEERDRKNKMIESDQVINATYLTYLLHTCHRLQRLGLFRDERAEGVVFDMTQWCLI